MADMNFDPKQKKDWVALLTLIGVIANAILDFIF